MSSLDLRGKVALITGAARGIGLPRRWAILSALRGLANPAIDAGMLREPRLRELVREADVEGRP